MDDQAPKTLNRLQVCSRLGVSPSGLSDLIREHKFPPGIKIGKEVLWFEKDLEAVMYLRGRGMWRNERAKKSPARAPKQEKP